MLYIMAAASVVAAFGDRSWGWAVGAVAFFVVAQVARRQLRKEAESDRREGPRLSFVGIAMLVMVVAILLMFWLTRS
jgi:hypothetical protein